MENNNKINTRFLLIVIIILFILTNINFYILSSKIDDLSGEISFSSCECDQKENEKKLNNIIYRVEKIQDRQSDIIDGLILLLER